MTFEEFLRILFVRPARLPQGFKHNPHYDAALLSDTMNQVPEVVRASNHQPYVYFEKNVTADVIALARAMGFKPHLHRSHKYFPPKCVFRARVRKKTSKVATELYNMDGQGVNECKNNPEYNQYIANYKLKTR